MEYGNDPSKAIEILSETTEGKPSRDEKILVSYLLRGAASGRISTAVAARAVCTAACTWVDLQMWLHAVETCAGDRSLDVLKEGGILDAISTFGFEPVRPAYVILFCRVSSRLSYDFCAGSRAS